MAGELTTKIRLVRCPRCKKVLPELPNFNVYKCGGCGATLQAKNRVDVVRRAEPDINTEVAVQEKQTNNVHEEKEKPSSQKKGVVVPCSEECSSCQNDESDQSAEQPSGVVQLPREDQNDGNYRSDSMDSENDGSRVSNEVFSPTEYIDDKDDRFVANGNAVHAESGDDDIFANREFSHDENEAAVNEEEEQSSDRENEGRDVRGDEDFSHPEFEELTHNEIERFARYENEDTSQEFGHTDTDDDDDDFSRDSGKAENEDSSREFIRNDNEVSSQEFNGEKIAETAHTLRALSFSRENLEFAVNEEGSPSAKANTFATINEKSGSDSMVRSYNNLGESSASGNLPVTDSLKSPRSALKQPQNKSPGAYGRMRSVEFVPSLELSGSPREALKSPTRSSQTYDGSDDQIPHKPLRLFEDDQSRTSFTRSQELTGRDEFMAQAIMNRETDRDGFLLPSRQRYSRPERHDLSSSSAFQRHTSFQSNLSEDPEQMMKVLKMVLEIQNQSKKSGPIYESVNDRVSELSPSPRYDPRDDPRYDPRDDPRYDPRDDPRYLARYASGSNYGAADRHRPKKIPFSGDPIGTGHQYVPREWSRSAQLPPPPSRYNAFPPSPQWSTNSEPPRRSQELSMNHRQSRRTARRHFLPVAQAAPFIVCYKCFTVLHIPPEFLISRKKCHRLICGACSGMLEFSLENGSRIVRYKETVRVPVPVPVPVPETPVEETPPQPRSDIEKVVEASDDRRSIEEDSDSGPPVPTPLGRAFDRIIFGVLNSVDDGSRELAPEPSRGRYNDRPPRHEPSKKAEAVEREENTGRSTSPLHRLMGYSSPSQVIYGSRPYSHGASGSSHSTRRGKKY